MGRKQVRKGKRFRSADPDDTARFLAQMDRDLAHDRDRRAEDEEPAAGTRVAPHPPTDRAARRVETRGRT